MNGKQIVNKYVKQAINALIAGMLIGIGELFYLYCLGAGQAILGGILFGLSLLMVLLYGFEYYTAKAGYAVENKALYLIDCLIAFVGNYAGAWLVALAVKMTSLTDLTNPLMAGLDQLVSSRIGNGLVFDVFGKSLLSGFILYFVVNTYKKAEQPIARFASVFIGALAVFSLGLDELVSSMFAYDLACLSGYAYGDLMSKLVYVWIGNTLGAMIVPAFRKWKGMLKS